VSSAFIPPPFITYSFSSFYQHHQFLTPLFIPSKNKTFHLRIFTNKNKNKTNKVVAEFYLLFFLFFYEPNLTIQSIRKMEQQMNQILSWDNPAPIIARKDKQLRTFCPIVLFHEHTYKNNNSEKCVKIHTGDEHHGEFIRSWKKRVDEMLQMNSRYWMIVAENSKYEKRLSLCGREDHLPQTAISIANSIYSHPLSHPQDPMDLTMKPKRRRGNLPKAVTALLKDWLAKHKKHPYPTEEEKLLLSRETKLSLQQISNWFINARRRHLPHLLESELSMNNQPAPELDIFPYEAAESADDNRMRCSGRISNKTGGVKKPKAFSMQHKRKAVSAL